MLETLVSSRIRRTLLEHILAHPDERFYLRGLAKHLGLSVSPLRRELLRLEQLGLLRAYDEANVRFYIVNQSCPMFQQLKQAASLPTAQSGELLASGFAKPVDPPGQMPTAQPLPPVASAPEPAGAVTPRPVVRASRTFHITQTLRDLLSVVVTTVLLAGMFGVIVYFGVPKAEAPRRTPSRMLQLSPVVPTTAQPQRSTTGEMKSSRWRVMPGAIGGGWSQ